MSEQGTSRYFLLPPPASAATRTVFLDLDETLIHSECDPSKGYDFSLLGFIIDDEEEIYFYVLKRPGVDEFLASLAAKGYEIVVFTAAPEEYASQVIDQIDPRRVVTHRLYSEACTKVGKLRVKDLARTGRDLSRCVIVDDFPISYSLQPENGVPVKPFVGDPNDRELQKLSTFFEGFDGFEDARDAVKDYLARKP